MPPLDYTKMDRYALIGQLERQDRIIRSLLRYIREITSTPPFSKDGKRLMEKKILDAVESCDGNKAAAAKIVGVCLKTVYNYLNRRELEEGSYHDHNRHDQNRRNCKQRKLAPVG